MYVDDFGVEKARTAQTRKNWVPFGWSPKMNMNRSRNERTKLYVELGLWCY